MAVRTGIVVQSFREVLFPSGMGKEMENKKEKLVWIHTRSLSLSKFSTGEVPSTSTY